MFCVCYVAVQVAISLFCIRTIDMSSDVKYRGVTTACINEAFSSCCAKEPKWKIKAHIKIPE